MNKQEITSSFLGAMGLTLSVQDLTQIVNLILLVLSVINILWVLFNRVREHIKNKQYEEIHNDINDAIEEINKAKEENKNANR